MEFRVRNPWFAKFRKNFTQKFLSKDTYPSLHLLTYKFKPPNESFPNDSTKEKETLFLLVLIFKILTIIFTQKKKRIIGIRFLHSYIFEGRKLTTIDPSIVGQYERRRNVQGTENIFVKEDVAATRGRNCASCRLKTARIF